MSSNQFCASESASALFKRLKCTPFVYNFGVNQHTVNFGEVVEAVSESSDRVKLLVHLAMNFLNRFEDSSVVLLTCGCSQVELLSVCSDAQDKELVQLALTGGSLKPIRVETLPEVLGVLELLHLSVGQRRTLVLVDGVSLLLQGQRALHRSSARLFVQCLQSLAALCEGHYAMCCWVTTYMLNRNGQNTLSNTTSPFNICTFNNDASSMIASAWKGTVRRVVHN